MILTLKYVWRAVVNEKGFSSVFITFNSVERVLLSRVTCKEWPEELRWVEAYWVVKKYKYIGGKQKVANGHG